MKTIYKYEIPVDDNIRLELPKGAEILSVQEQYGKPCIWAIVDPEKEVEGRLFELLGTGHNIKASEIINRKYIGTFQLYNGALVFHLFELI